jgi:hypothetical protein
MWNTTTLSQARYYLAATSLGNLAFFGGGYDRKQSFNVVDIFNSTSQTWSNTTLSQARYQFAASSIGEIVAFGGGSNGSTSYSVVDMLNVTNNIWFTFTLSQPRSWLASTSSSNKIFFGGGVSQTLNTPSNVVDIFEITFPLPPNSLVSSSSISPVPTTSTENTSGPSPPPKLRESGKKVSIDHLITALPKRRTDFILWINFYFIPVFTGIVFLATAFFVWDKFISLEETD